MDAVPENELEVEVSDLAMNDMIRIDDMDANGTSMSLDFATPPGFAGEKRVAGHDEDPMLAMLRQGDARLGEPVGFPCAD